MRNMVYKIYNFILFVLIFIAGLAHHGYSQQMNSINKKETITIVDTCLSAFEKHYIYPDVVVEIREYLKQKIEKNQYSDITNKLDFTKQLRKDFRHVTKDRHIWIDIMENILITDKAVPIEEIIKEKKKNNFGFVEFKWLDGNIAYLLIDGFNDIEYAKETAIHAMGMLANSKIIILDFRNNHGGHGNMVHFISSYFYEDKTQLNSLYFREADSLAEAWTDPNITGKKLLKQKVFILTSKNTTSAAESFTYTMKHYNRATIVGEYTRGAAHWKETFKFPDLGIFLEIPVARPINPITKKGWEGEGVKPDVQVLADEAFEKAIELALEGK